MNEEQNPKVEPDGLLVVQVQEHIGRFARQHRHAPSVAHLLTAFKDEPTLTQNALTDILWDWWGRHPALPGDPATAVLPPVRRPRRYHVREMSGFAANRAVVDYWRSESGDECAIFFKAGLPDYVEHAQNLADLLNARHDEQVGAAEARKFVTTHLLNMPNSEVRELARVLQDGGSMAAIPAPSIPHPRGWRARQPDCFPRNSWNLNLPEQLFVPTMKKERP